MYKILYPYAEVIYIRTISLTYLSCLDDKGCSIIADLYVIKSPNQRYHSSRYGQSDRWKVHRVDQFHSQLGHLYGFKTKQMRTKQS